MPRRVPASPQWTDWSWDLIDADPVDFGRVKHVFNKGGKSFNPMAAMAQYLFRLIPRHAHDETMEDPWITSIVATQDGRLVMADRDNYLVKIACGTNLETLLVVRLEDQPFTLALLHDGLVAVTSGGKSLHLVDVSGHPSVVSRVQTARQYRGVTAGATPDTLIVCARPDDDGSGQVYVITRAGDVRQTVTDIGYLQTPDYLCLIGQHVFVSDWESHKVFRIDIATGHFATLEHGDMKYPCQVATDGANNLYIACYASKCVLVMSPDGMFRVLVTGLVNRSCSYSRADGVCVMGSKLVVAWRKDNMRHGQSTVAVYQL